MDRMPIIVAIAQGDIKAVVEKFTSLAYDDNPGSIPRLTYSRARNEETITLSFFVHTIIQGVDIPGLTSAKAKWTLLQLTPDLSWTSNGIPLFDWEMGPILFRKIWRAKLGAVNLDVKTAGNFIAGPWTVPQFDKAFPALSEQLFYEQVPDKIDDKTGMPLTYKKKDGAKLQPAMILFGEDPFVVAKPDYVITEADAVADKKAVYAEVFVKAAEVEPAPIKEEEVITPK